LDNAHAILRAHPNEWMWIDESIGMRLCKLNLAQWRGPKGERRFRYGISRKRRERLEGMPDVKPGVPILPREG
jgi:hypothetical protein